MCTYGDGKGCCVKDGALLKRLIVNYYIPLLRKMWFKVTVLVSFTVLTAVMAWSASNLKQDFQFRWFVNDDAKLQETFDVQDTYFASTGLPVNIVTPSSTDFDYTTIANQKKIVALGAAIRMLRRLALR